MPTLRQVLKETDEHRWAGTRSRRSSFCQAQIAVDTLEDITGPGISFASIQKHHLQRAVKVWLAAGSKPSTVGARLSCLSAMGLDVTGCRPKIPNSLKWWLSPQAEAELLPWLRASMDRDLHTLADYVIWATLKALRRNAARNLHATKGMPLDMVRQYLRHGNVKTTMGYLRLTGGYGENEMAEWL